MKNYTSHAENVRNNYRRQGEVKVLKELIALLQSKPSVTTDYLAYYLKQRATND